MKKLLCLWLLVASPAWATTNLIEFQLGRGTPISSMQSLGSSDHIGSRGTDWSADFLHQADSQFSFGLGGGQFRSNDNTSTTFWPGADTVIRSRTSSILILSRTDIPSRSKMAPYVIAGVGWVKNSIP